MKIHDPDGPVLDPETHPLEWCEQRCSLCVLEGAWHKVAEDPSVNEMQHVYVDSRFEPVVRHELTNYVCCLCFGRLMGSVAHDWCRAFWRAAKLAKDLADKERFKSRDNAQPRLPGHYGGE